MARDRSSHCSWVCGPKLLEICPQRIGGLLQRVETQRLPQVLANALQCRPLDARPHIVEHQAPHGHRQRQIGHARNPHADQPAHAGAHPVQRGRWAPAGALAATGPACRRRTPAPGRPWDRPASRSRPAPPRPGRSRAPGGSDARARMVEVASLPRQAMHADDDMRMGRDCPWLVPLPVGHAVPCSQRRRAAAGHRARYVVQRRFNHGNGTA